MIRTVISGIGILTVGTVGLFHDPANPMTRSHLQAKRPPRVNDVWESLYSLDPAVAVRHHSPDIRRFAAALQCILAGKNSESRQALLELTRSPDYRIRANSALLLRNMIPNQDFILAGVGVPTEPSETLEEPVSIPFRTGRSGLAMVSSHVNGQRCTMILDSGSTYSVLDDVTAARLGVRILGKAVFARNIAGNTVSLRPGVVEELRIGNLTFRNHPVAVIDKKNLIFWAPRKTFGIDGLIGWNTLQYCRVTIDMRKMRIVFTPPAESLEGERNLFWLGYPLIRIRDERGGWLNFGLDIGAGRSFLTPVGLSKLGHLRIYQGRIRMSGVGEKLNFVSRFVSELLLDIGNRSVRLTNLIVMPVDYGTFVRIDGIIGFDVASGYRISFDLKAGRFAMQPYARIRTESE